MHGLFNRAVQCFLRDNYGPDMWDRVARDARLGFSDFEPLFRYDPAMSDAVVAAASRALNRSRESLLEDIGTYLVSNPELEAVRRLLRFGGVTFRDFVNSLEDFPDRCRLALPGAEVPILTLREDETGYVLTCDWSLDGVGHLVVGLLRAMADDYGTLAFLEHTGRMGRGEVVAIRLVEAQLFAGRPFDLAARA